MIAKLLTAAVTTLFAMMVIRQFIDRQEKAKVKVRKQCDPKRVSRLRQDPKTGVYRPED